MKEINEKDLEHAAGGAVDIRNTNYDAGRECDKYEPKSEAYRNYPEYQTCLTCAHYQRIGSDDVCHAGM